MARTFIRRQGERRKGDPNRRQRVRVQRWVDPFWYIQGSSIEKMVFAEFVRRGIYFEHTPQTNTLGGAVDPSWEPDFLLPQYRIWIEIQGGYFHMLPGQPEADAFRFAAIEQTGWKPIFWWEDDIRARLPELIDAVPELYGTQAPVDVALPKTLGQNWFEGGDGIDHLAGLRKALSNRTRPPVYARRVATKRRPK